MYRQIPEEYEIKLATINKTKTGKYYISVLAEYVEEIEEIAPIKETTLGLDYPSSKLCHNCNAINKELTLSQRIWTCSNCEKELDRDINAAINIKNEGLRTSEREVKTVLLKHTIL